MGASCSSPREKPVAVQEVKEVDISDFEIGIAIGKGSFGRVRIAQHRHSKVRYACKYMNKEEVIRRKCTRHVLNERKLLEQAKHPFIVNMRYAFKDDENMVMILDLKLGGDLRYHLNFKGRFSEERGRFYFSELACAVGYLHSLNIVHRDIKPENILLDSRGHASLTDFNVARKYKEGKMLNSRTGSARYMAPEVITRSDYLNEVDWWSLAVTTYELLYRHAPFQSRIKDELHQQILNDEVTFPEYPDVVVSDAAKDLLARMLVKPRTERLGSIAMGGFGAIKKHFWFKGMRWSSVEAMEIPVPYVPDENSQYHDPSLGLEEILSGRTELPNAPVKNSKHGKPFTALQFREKLAESKKQFSSMWKSGKGRRAKSSTTGSSETIVCVPELPSTPAKDTSPPAVATIGDATVVIATSSQLIPANTIPMEDQVQIKMIEKEFLTYDFTKPKQNPVPVSPSQTLNNSSSNTEIFSESGNGASVVFLQA
ncbi:UNVERIFIED_CONTAM: hypothetical protein HDU68_012469 [Siphonaria sp. JEL0065]|nr:hypothetical protein HDU68_012469 [Siphonaria sp. JEL0065]